VGDVRVEDDVERAVERAIECFGRIDVCVNNASALALDGTEQLSIKRLELMMQIQQRGTFLLTRRAMPALRRAPNPHVLTLSPPLNLSARWLGAHPGYTMAKYAMTLLALGWAAEFADAGVASNALWPQTLIATAAVDNLLGGGAALAGARDPQIMADAALAIVQQPSCACTGNTFLDVDVLRATGVHDFGSYGGGAEPTLDVFVDPDDAAGADDVAPRRQAG
jgi:NAD(P)-dependent dehydrogenase (short-subunit alcohol dehydrogenase family)